MYILYCQMVDLRNIEDYSVWLNYKLQTYPKKILKHFVIYIEQFRICRSEYWFSRYLSRFRLKILFC